MKRKPNNAIVIIITKNVFISLNRGYVPWTKILLSVSELAKMRWPTTVRFEVEFAEGLFGVRTVRDLELTLVIGIDKRRDHYCTFEIYNYIVI